MVEEERVVTRRRYAGDPLGVDREVVVERTARPSAADMLARIVLLVFGVIQVVLLLRILGQLIDANRNNEIVRSIYDVSAVLVTPFEGIIRTTGSGSSVLDVTAIVALVGWTILELLILAAVGIFRREPV